jgi:hypothetical protein
MTTCLESGPVQGGGARAAEWVVGTNATHQLCHVQRHAGHTKCAVLQDVKHAAAHHHPGPLAAGLLVHLAHLRSVSGHSLLLGFPP